jgi:uncharacterized integral membrane protein (TIGR00698 family)
MYKNLASFVNERWRSAALLILALASLVLLSSAQAFMAGIAVAILMGHPFSRELKAATPKLIAIAIITLGFGMNLRRVAMVGLSGLHYTLAGLLLTFLLSALIGKLLGTPRNITTLLSAGTGVCGGSAIAAIAPVIKARHEEIAVAFGIVFFLNATALIAFPFLGRYFDLDDQQFGLWCALAIHDTSSVLGAAMQFGDTALKLATTVKLSRALWIIPLAFTLSLFKHDDKAQKASTFPWFIGGFLLASALVTFIPALNAISGTLQTASQRLMVLTLFFIGAGMSKEHWRTIGPSPLVHGILVWIIVSIVSLMAIKMKLVSVL